MAAASYCNWDCQIANRWSVISLINQNHKNNDCFQTGIVCPFNDECVKYDSIHTKTERPQQLRTIWERILQLLTHRPTALFFHLCNQKTGVRLMKYIGASLLRLFSAQGPVAAETDGTFTLVTMYLKKLFHHLPFWVQRKEWGVCHRAIKKIV